jgi:hypothetical protein
MASIPNFDAEKLRRMVVLAAEQAQANAAGAIETAKVEALQQIDEYSRAVKDLDPGTLEIFAKAPLAFVRHFDVTHDPVPIRAVTFEDHRGGGPLLMIQERDARGWHVPLATLPVGSYRALVVILPLPKPEAQ